MKYTLCFIRRGDELLMLNRIKKSEMGLWNGVGGSIEPGETPEQCVIREVSEETEIRLNRVAYVGSVTWIHSTLGMSGMHVFIAEVPVDFIFETPLLVDEGVLDWKYIHWILNPDNQGISNKIKDFLPHMLEGHIYDHRYFYDVSDVNIRSERIEKYLNQDERR